MTEITKDHVLLYFEGLLTDEELVERIEAAIDGNASDIADWYYEAAAEMRPSKDVFVSLQSAQAHVAREAPPHGDASDRPERGRPELGRDRVVVVAASGGVPDRRWFAKAVAASVAGVVGGGLLGVSTAQAEIAGLKSQLQELNQLIESLGLNEAIQFNDGSPFQVTGRDTLKLSLRFDEHFVRAIRCDWKAAGLEGTQTLYEASGRPAAPKTYRSESLERKLPLDGAIIEPEVRVELYDDVRASLVGEEKLHLTRRFLLSAFGVTADPPQGPQLTLTRLESRIQATWQGVAVNDRPAWLWVVDRYGNAFFKGNVSAAAGMMEFSHSSPPASILIARPPENANLSALMGGAPQARAELQALAAQQAEVSAAPGAGKKSHRDDE